MPNLSTQLLSAIWRKRVTTFLTLLNGGTIGQVWSKDSSTDDDATWKSVLSAMDDSGDYETGTFTPAITVSGTTGTITHSTQNGDYQVLGSRCHVVGEIILSAFSGNTGDVRLSNLPFAASSSTVARTVFVMGNTRGATFTDYLTGYIQNGETYITLVDEISAGTSANLAAATDIASNLRLRFAGSYPI